MIQFRSPEERDIIFYFAGHLQDPLTAKILANETPINAETALHLSTFFWKMVDCSAQLSDAGHYPWNGGSEYWCEKIMYSICASLEKTNFIDIFDSVLERKDEHLPAQ